MTSHVEFADFATTLADAASKATLPLFRSGIAVDNKAGSGGFDPVTEADKQAEAEIRTLIKSTYPDHGIFGEEHGLEEGDSDYLWVLDPIDGTRAFISGIPLWGTLIALHDGKTPIVGLMDQPYIGERFIGVDNEAYLERGGKRKLLKARSCKTLRDATFSTTTPELFETPAEKQGFDILHREARLTRFGCDCYAYSLIAAGGIDLVVEVGLKPYDIQALIPIVTGAGGVVTNWRGEPADQGGDIIAAATPALHAEVLGLLKPLAKAPPSPQQDR